MFISARASVGLFFFTGAAVAFAQNGSIDLTASPLAGNANLPVNNHPGLPLTNRLANAQNMATAKGITSDTYEYDIYDSIEPGFTVQGLLQIYQRRACYGDAIVIGHINKAIYHLSSSGTTIYGDYDFSVDSILKDNAAASIAPTKEIVLTRPGGTLTMGSGSVSKVTFLDERFPLLSTNTSYLILLRYSPATGSYYAVDHFSTFLANGLIWSIARQAYSKITAPQFARGALESNLSAWLASCGH